MNDYLEILRSRISAPEDVSTIGSVISQIAKDRGALREFLRAYLSLYTVATERRSLHAAGNFISLIPDEIARKGSLIFDFGVSLHQPSDVQPITSLSAYTSLTSINDTFHIDFYAISKEWDPEIFDPSIELTRSRTEVLQECAVLSLTPANEACQFRFNSPTLILKVQSKSVVPFEWSFDELTKKAWQCVPAALLDSNAEYSCVRAQALRDNSLAPELESMLEHPRHFVRWAAARALGMLSFEQGVLALKRLESDPHPHVARAASRALKNSNLTIRS